MDFIIEQHDEQMFLCSGTKEHYSYNPATWVKESDASPASWAAKTQTPSGIKPVG
jgi:hypothetical protein